MAGAAAVARRSVGLLALLCAGCPEEDREPAALVVVEAAGIGVLGQTPPVTGRDGGASGLAFGRSVWTFGDTVLAQTDQAGTTWHTNSFGVADPAAWRDGLASPVDPVGAPIYFVPLSDEERAWNALHAAEDCPEEPCRSGWALWPGAPLVHPERGWAWVLYGLYNDHRPSGIGLARWEGIDQPVERVRFGGSWLLFPKPEPEWANAPVVHGDHLYAFGCPLDFVARPCRLARVPFDEADHRDAWRFWDGDGWSASMGDAVTLFDGAPIMAVSWNEALGRWLLVYSDSFGGTVYARTGRALEGPWSETVALFSAPGSIYDAQHHAELEEGGGLVQYVTYSRPTGGWFGSEHAVWRVTLARP